MTDWGFVDREDIRWEIVEAVAKIKVETHGSVAGVAVKTDLARMSIFEAGLCPRVKYITRRKNSLRGDNGFNRISAVEAELPVGGAVRQSKGKVTSPSAAVVERVVLATDGHRYW